MVSQKISYEELLKENEKLKSEIEKLNLNNSNSNSFICNCFSNSFSNSFGDSNLSFKKKNYISFINFIN